MNGVESSAQGSGSIRLAFGNDEHAESTAGGISKVDGTPCNEPVTWPVCPAASASAFQKMPAGLSSAHQLKADLVRSHSQQHPASQLQLNVQEPLTHGNLYKATSSGRPSRGALPQECLNAFEESEARDLVLSYRHRVFLNGEPSVLGNVRGEVMNALNMISKENLEAKSLAASQNHMKAERRRRERINTHFATLRSLLPSSSKADKASVLADVIDQVKMLKHQVSEIEKYSPMPTDHDHLRIEKVRMGTEGRLVIRASLCCDDRPGLMKDLKVAMDGLMLRTLKAEISTLEGRIKNIFTVTHKEEAFEPEGVLIRHMRKALQVVMDGPGCGELSSGSANKRQRVSSLE